jgi:hypothetical protein
MTRRRLLLILASVGSPLLCCGGFEFLASYPMNGIRVGPLEADLNERLPDGSTWEQAEVWFASHKIQPGVAYEIETNRKAGLNATIPNDSVLLRARIQIDLQFDPDGRLQKRSIRRYTISF